MSHTGFYRLQSIARAKHTSFLNQRIGLLCARLIVTLICRKYDTEFRWAMEAICAGFRFGLTFAVTPVSCCRRPKRSRPRDGCEGILRPKTWLRSRRNGWSGEI